MKVWNWVSDTISEEVVDTLPPGPRIRVVSEIPMTREREPLPRRGNRYYPTMVDIWFGDHWPDDGTERSHLLLADDARLIGEALIRAADKADATDKADTDPCGHWAPCSGCLE